MKSQNVAVLLGALFALGVVFFGVAMNQPNDPVPDVQNSAPINLLEKQIDQKVPDSLSPQKKIIEVSDKDSTELVNNEEGQDPKYTDDRIPQPVRENPK